MNHYLPFPHQKNILLSKFSTLKVGGNARYFVQVKSKKQMEQVVAYAYENTLRFHILGKGSNTLFDDQGFNGLVILNRIDELKQEGSRFTVGSGYSFARLGGMTARRGFGGLEFASGIPATVGGAVYMNAGANGNQTADRLIEVGYIEQNGVYETFAKDRLQFGYRRSCFQKKRGVIVSATFELDFLKKASVNQKEMLNYRLNSQPFSELSAGCAFRNPPGDSAGRLIESVGLKGVCVGGAQVSEKHANFILNVKEATARDVLDLIDKIKQKVYQRHGHLLEEEIRYIPYEASDF